MQYCNTRSKGTTLFEVLLYIGLFSIISTAVVYFYISVLKASDTLTLNLQKIELSIFIRQLAVSQIDANASAGRNSYGSSYINTQEFKNAMERILKYYPNLKLIDIQVEYMFLESAPQIIDARIGTNIYPTVKLMYQLQLQSQSQSKKIFSNTIYISSS